MNPRSPQTGFSANSARYMRSLGLEVRIAPVQWTNYGLTMAHRRLIVEGVAAAATLCRRVVYPNPILDPQPDVPVCKECLRRVAELADEEGR